MKVSDFKVLGKLPDVYELERGKVYLVICDGKKFSYKQAHALLELAESEGVSFHIVATFDPKALILGIGTVEGGEGSDSGAGAGGEVGASSSEKV